MPSNITPLRPEDFIKLVSEEKWEAFNCLRFAVTTYENLSKMLETSTTKFTLLDSSLEVGASLMKFIGENKEVLGFAPSNFRRISSEEELLPGQWGLKIYGFVEVQIGQFCGFPLYRPDFHVERISYDAETVHKFGWRELPCTVTPEHKAEIKEEFGDNFACFVFIPTQD